jgi:CheY-like chemotaxis protein
MAEDLFFMVVEDREADRDEVLDRLADHGFSRERLLATPTSYEEAQAAIAHECERLDVVFLDLNIPRNYADAHPERGHGRAILEYIHKDLNQRLGVDIKVIVVSGEDLLDGWNDRNLEDAFPGTLAGICPKTVLADVLPSRLKRLRRDPLLARTRKADLNIVADYHTLFDGQAQVEARLEAARRIAIRLVINEVDQYRGKLNSCPELRDDLIRLLRDHIEQRFRPDKDGRPKVKCSLISTTGGWGSFLWRGATMQHLYAINSYRNTFAHMNEQPYRSDDPSSWTPDAGLVERQERGTVVGDIVAMMIKELLEWYLPWHEQVYRPWLEGLRK